MRGTAQTAPAARRKIHPGSYAIIYFLFAAFLISTHLWAAHLPYFWDEAGQFIPAALDLLHTGSWVPHSTLPNIHPPAVAAYLAGAWRIAGFYPETTRVAMLILAAFGALAAFLLAIELTRESRGAPAFLAAGLLCVSPLFFAQSMLAQLDAPAMIFTTLALLLFFQGRLRLSAAVCVALVLVKETGAVVPVVLGFWLARERRWRDAAWFAAPLLVVAAWVGILARQTGHWAGNADFAAYNVRYPLHPVRLLVTLVRRVYFLTVANFHWIGTAAMVYAWRKGRMFRSRPWQVAATLTLAHVVLFTFLGGAVLNRYLLPVLPIVLAAMAAAISTLPRVSKIAATVAILAGTALSNFINPPYPFPFEENLAFTDFLKLHADAADYIAHWYSNPVVYTAWPMSMELSRPELGFVTRTIRVESLPNLTTATLESLDWSKVQMLVVFSRNWDPPVNLLRMASPLIPFWQSYYGFVPNATPEEARARVPFPVDQTFTRRGQWVDIYVNPDLPRIPHLPVRVAAR
jgi:4-amino-4-deoxy-L-arabinose transferase-like glycosyltransferase